MRNLETYCSSENEDFKTLRIKAIVIISLFSNCIQAEDISPELNFVCITESIFSCLTL